MAGKDLISMNDLTSEEVSGLIKSAIELKQKRTASLLSEKTLALLFEKPSLRTRVSFDVAMNQLGGHTIYLSPAEIGLGKRESIADVARVLSRYVDVMVARTFAHQTVESLAKHALVPVINGLSDREHPCQVLADLQTICEKKGKLKGLTLAYVGDGNNVAASLLLGCALTGINFRAGSPRGYEIGDEVLDQGRRYAAQNASQIILFNDPWDAVSTADVVYTDVWTSMGQEAESEKRREVFASFQVGKDLMAAAGKNAIFMHPLPAHHGEEVAEGIVDSPQSVVFDQAENRLHAQKAVLLKLLGK